MIVTDDIRTPMRDGTILAGKVFRPSTPTGPLPAVLMRNPYNGGKTPPIWDGLCEDLAVQGYAVINQDVRGTNLSEGDFRPFFQEGADGYDTVEWVGTQPWCNGKVGLWGISYLGACALHAAVERPPHLVAISARMVASNYHDHWVYENGIVNSLFIEEWTDNFVRRDAAADARPPFYAEWMEHPAYDDYWRAIDLTTRCSAIDIPVRLKGGWFDLFSIGTLALHKTLAARTDAPVELVVAPECHGPWLATGLQFPKAPFCPPDMDADWWDRHLKDNGSDAKAPVSLYVMRPPLRGVVDDGRWTEHATFPVSTPVPFALVGSDDGGGRGRLVREAAPAGPTARIEHDPANPVPTLGGALGTSDPRFIAGVVDQASLLTRNDVLIYESDPLPEELVIAGKVVLTFWACSADRDALYAVKMAIARPDGTILNMLDRAVPVKPSGSAVEGKMDIERYDLDLGSIALMVQPGLRLCLFIAASNHPRFVGTTAQNRRKPDHRPRTQSIHHSHSYPSTLMLPIAKGL